MSGLRLPTDLDRDSVHMGEAISLARQAMEKGEVPIGALVVFEGAVIGAAHNAPVSLHDPTAHAEVLALRQAAQSRGNYRLSGASLYVTVEPCVMCVGALMLARVSRVIFGCHETKTGALGSVLLLQGPGAPAFEVRGGIRGDECRTVLQEFFAARRRDAID